MHKNVVVAMATAAVVAIVAVLLMNKPPLELSIIKPSSEEKAYLYSVDPGIETAVYIPLRDGAVFGLVDYFSLLMGRLDFIYYMTKDGVVSEIAKMGDIRWKYTYFNRPGMLCKNYTATGTVAGETLTITYSRCKRSFAPLSEARSFDEVVVLVRQLFHSELLLYTPHQLNWQRSDTVQTPFGQAVVYTSTIKIAENLRDSYEKRVLRDGAVYYLKTPEKTYTLRNVTAVTPELRRVIDELYKDVVVDKPSGGLSLLRVAQKVGMSYDGQWPAAIVFFNLDSDSSARFFKYNYTLFQGHKLVLVDLAYIPDIPTHERLRCLYQTSPDEVIPTLRVLYDRYLAKDPNYTSVLPPKRCPFDASAGEKMARLLYRIIPASLIVVVVYPDDTYTVIAGYRPAEVAKALKR